PNEWQVAPDRQAVLPGDVGRPVIGKIENLQGRADGGKSLAQDARIGLRSAQAQQRVAVTVADTVLHRAAVVEPYMRQSRTRPRAWNICHELVWRPLARPRGDQRRADIAIAKLGADHFRRLVLLDIGDARQLLAQRRAGGRSLADLRPIE